MFGDTVMGALLTALPLGSHFAVKLTSLVMALATVAMGLFVLGFTRPELNRITRAVLVGIIMIYSFILTVLGKGAKGAALAARTTAQARTERRAAKAEAAAIAQAEATAMAQATPMVPQADKTVERGTAEARELVRAPT